MLTYFQVKLFRQGKPSSSDDDDEFFSYRSAEDFLQKNRLGLIIRAGKCGEMGYSFSHGGLELTIATASHLEDDKVGSYVVIENGRFCISTYPPIEIPT
jgi:hypothetical protein